MTRIPPALVALLLGLAAPDPARSDVEITIQGEVDVNGIFDPSVEYDPSGAVGWLAYSSIYGTVRPWGPHVETRLARSLDAGSSWSFVQVVHASTPATLVRPGLPDLDGVWNYETASLVHDPDDPGAEWKLFAHRIFRKTEQDFVDEQSLPAYSWIVSRSAADPAGSWDPEVALLSSGPLPPAPYDTVRVAVNDLDPSLASLVVYSEPGVFYRSGVLYLCLTGLSAAGPDRIVLLASDDHGAAWRYVATLLTNTDAAALGYESFDGSALAEDRGRVFLMVTANRADVTHDGTLVFELEDLPQGRLLRQAGVPVVQVQLPAKPGTPADRRGGQADFHRHNRNGGVLQPSLQLDDFPRFFQIYATGRTLAATTLPATGSLALGVTGGLLLAIGVARAASRAASGGLDPQVAQRVRHAADRRGQLRVRLLELAHGLREAVGQGGGLVCGVAVEHGSDVVGEGGEQPPRLVVDGGRAIELGVELAESPSQLGVRHAAKHRRPVCHPTTPRGRRLSPRPGRPSAPR